MAPFAHSLRGNLQSSDIGARREILLFEDIRNPGIETLLYGNGITLGRLQIRGFIEAQL